MPSIVPRVRSDGGTSWQVKIRIKKAGKTVHAESKTFSDKKYKYKEVELWALSREKELESPETAANARWSHFTFGDGIKRYIKEFGTDGNWGRSKNSAIKALIDEPIADKPWVELLASDWIEHIQLRRKGGAGPSTANNDLVWARVLYRVARPSWNIPVDVSVIDDAAVVCRGQRLVERPKSRERRPSITELNKLLTWFSERDGRAAIPMIDLVLFALYSARRQAEICRITWADLVDSKDDWQSYVIVRDMKDPRSKKGNDVKVFLPPEAMAIIRRQPKAEGEPRIFPYNSKSISCAFTRTCKLVEIEGLRFHDLRHEGTSRLFELGHDIPRVSQVTGHRSWQNLQRYTHLQAHGVVDKYDGWQWAPANPD